MSARPNSQARGRQSVRASERQNGRVLGSTGCMSLVSNWPTHLVDPHQWLATVVLRLERGAPPLQLLPLESRVVAPRVGQERVDLAERCGLGAGREGGVGRVTRHVLFGNEVERDGAELEEGRMRGYPGRIDDEV